MEVAFRYPTQEDIEFVTKNMRDADIIEVEAQGLTRDRAIPFSCALSDECFTGLTDGVPTMILGYSLPLLGNSASIWGLGTPRCFQVPRQMLTVGREIIRYFLTKAPCLYAYCDARNVKSLCWLRHLGFTIGDTEPRGIHGELFRKVVIGKED